MAEEKFETIKKRVEAGTDADGRFKRGLAGSEVQASAAADLRWLIAEVERLRSENQA